MLLTPNNKSHHRKEKSRKLSTSSFLICMFCFMHITVNGLKSHFKYSPKTINKRHTEKCYENKGVKIPQQSSAMS